MTADPSGFINLGVLCLGNSGGSKLVVRMIMMTRIILSRIKEALQYQSRATVAHGQESQDDDDHENSSHIR